MRSLVAIRFVHFEDLGYFETALKSHGYVVSYVDPTTEEIGAIDPAAPDLLAVLGGPIGAYEDELYPALRPVLKIIEGRLRATLPTIGICLGAQLMARALGARVYRGPRKEICWGQIRSTEAGHASALRHIETTRVLHWHGDTFDLPSGATLL